MIFDSYLHTQENTPYLTHNELLPQHRTILIIHGLGDSSISYQEFLSSEKLKDFNILIPDLLGHGRSSNAQDYSFQHQVNGILQHINFLETQWDLYLNDFILITHSMGGIHGTLLCESELKEKIKYFINVEGSITQYGSFVSHQVAKINQKDFINWFDNFKIETYNLGKKFTEFKSYDASLQFCRTQAFLQNALEMYQMSVALPGKFTHLIGEKYKALTLPKIYCYGNSMCSETLDFLKENNLHAQHFNFPTHLFMPTAFEKICKLLNP